MATTNYSDVFKKFLQKCRDLQLSIDLSDISTEDLGEEKMLGYMETACATFLTCKKDLTARNDTLKMFTIQLSPLEIEIISKKMVLEWMESKIATFDLLTMYVSDLKHGSQANMIDKVVMAKRELGSDINNLEVQYSYYSIDTTQPLGSV